MVSSPHSRVWWMSARGEREETSSRLLDRQLKWKIVKPLASFLGFKAGLHLQIICTLEETDWFSRDWLEGGGGDRMGGGQSRLLEGGELEYFFVKELLAVSVDSVEVIIAGNTFQQKTRVRSQEEVRQVYWGSGGVVSVYT